MSSRPHPASELIDFLDTAISTERVNPSTGTAYKAACRAVLGQVEGAQWPETDVLALDVDELLSEFGDQAQTRYKAQSLNAYKSRFRQAVALFRASIEAPGTWAAASSPKRSSGSRGSRRGRPLIVHRFPVQPDLVVELQLPVDLQEPEAKRVAVFVMALVTPGDPASTLSAGGS